MSARIFTLTITVDDEADGTVEVQEKGDKANRGKAKVPPGMFGVREGLILGGQLVRNYYKTKQRLLILERREAEVERRRAERIAAKPKPEPKPPDPAQTTLAPSTETLVHSVKHAGIGDEDCADCIEAKRAAYSDATTPGFFPPYCPKHAPVPAEPAAEAVCAQCNGAKGTFVKAEGKPEEWHPCTGCQTDLTVQVVEEEPAPEPVDAAIDRVVTINDRLKKAVAK